MRLAKKNKKMKIEREKFCQTWIKIIMPGAILRKK